MSTGPLFFQGAEIAMSSGTTDGVFSLVQRVQSINTSYQIPRTNTNVIGRMKPLNERYVVNYTPVSLSCNYTKGNKDVERNLGLLNTTGVAIQIGQNTQVTNWGARNFQIYNAPINSPNYAGQWNVVTGILKTFSLAGSVGGVVEGSFNVEALDLQQVANNTARTIPLYSGQVIKSENISITGIDFTGLGFSGLTIQSFNFQINLNHAATFEIGTQFPKRRITDGTAALQIVGFMEGVTNTITSLNTYACGSFITGTYVLGLTPGCSSEPATNITMVYPYLESQSVGTQVGNYTQIDLSFLVPLTTVPMEATGAGYGSNVTIT